MATSENWDPEVRSELADLRARPVEAEGTLSAIRGGEMGALPRAGNQGGDVHLPGEGGRIDRHLAETGSEREDRHRAILQASMDGFWVVDTQGRLLEVNESYCRMSGYSAQELLAMRISDLDASLSADVIAAEIQKVMKEGDARFGSRQRRKDGSVFDVEVSIQYRPAEGGRLFVFIRDITERKRTEDTLRQSEEKLRAILDATPFPIAVVDLQDDNIRLWSRSALALFGHTAPTASQWYQIAYPDPGYRRDVIQRWKPFLETARASRETVNTGLYRVTCRDGSERVCELHVGFLPDNLVVTFSDVTERQRAEEALRESETTFRILFEQATDGMLLADAATKRITLANPHMQQMLGYSEAELLQLTVADLHPHADLPNVIELFEKQARGDSALSPDLPMLRKDGSVFYVNISSARVRLQQRDCLLGISRDITARKRESENLRRMATVVRDSNDAITIQDFEGRITAWNRGAELMYGHSEADALLMNIDLLTTPGKVAEQKEFIRRLVAGEAITSFETQRVTKDGRVLDVWMTVTKLMDDAGNPIGLASTERDITERLHAAQEKTRLEDQIRQSQKMEAIGNLAGGVAHDFNNITAIVLGYGEMLLGQLGPEDPARKTVEQILAAGRRSAVLTRQLLAFSRKQTLRPVVLDLNALLRNLESMLGRLIGEDIELELRLASDSCRVTADAGQIEQVVMNLVANARDAMSRGGRLTLETTAVELERTYALGPEYAVAGRYVMLALTDTGSGMDKATMAKIYEPFFTTKDVGKGTGLGLATAYGIVKQSGGYIWVYSEPGKGTTFKVYLPRTDAEPQTAAVEVRGEPPRGREERILLVEDEASLLELCATVLSGLGYRVSSAESGPRALLLAGKEGFETDLVVTDVVMPGMSGPEMVERLRKNRPGLRVLYMSGYPDQSIAHHGILDPGTPLLQKPFTDRALAVEVRKALGGMAEAVGPKRRILMIDDDEQYRELVQHFCSKGGHFFSGVDSAAGALATLPASTFDVLLVDLSIPGTSGEQVLREIRAAGHATPAIVLTGDVASANLEMLRPLGVVRALEKSSDGGPLLQAIAEASPA